MKGLIRVASLGCLAPVLLAGCYTYSYLPTAPAPDTRLALDLTDRGRAAEYDHLGPDVVRVEGKLISLDTMYTLRVDRTVTIRGTTQPWNGEEVHIPLDYVATAREKRFSPTRSALLAGVATASVVGFIATRVLGAGNGTGVNLPPPGGGQNGS